MTKKHFVCTIVGAVATLSIYVPLTLAQNTFSSAATPIEMVTVDRTGTEKRLRSLDGVMEPVGVAAGDQIAINLEAPNSKAGQPVSVRLLDGGEIIAPPALSVATNGRVGFTFKAGGTRGLYRVEVILGVEQYRTPVLCRKALVTEEPWKNTLDCWFLVFRSVFFSHTRQSAQMD